MSEERLLRLRQSMNRKRPRFLHQEHWKLKRFRKAPWRKPRGKRSKMRAKEKAKPFMVTVGYRGPKKVRGWHPRGMPQTVVYNVGDIEKLKERGDEGEKKGKKRKREKTERGLVIKVSSTVGNRKKLGIVKRAVEKGLYVANPSIEFVKLSSMEELESALSIKKYIKKWYISDRVPDEEKEEMEDRAEEEGIEVVE